MAGHGVPTECMVCGALMRSCVLPAICSDCKKKGHTKEGLKLVR